MKKKPSILVVGAGYVGLATAVFFARKGNIVTNIEKKEDVVKRLRKADLHFHEPILKTNLKKVIKSKHLIVDVPSKEHYQHADLIFIAIDSANRSNWQMDLAPFKNMADWIGSVKRKRQAIVVLKSTNVYGFAEKFNQFLQKTPYGKDVHLMVNPEFLREGFAYEDTENPWRIVIGAENKKAASRLISFYRTVYKKTIPLFAGSWGDAELIKLASNLYLAHRLAFINEIAEFSRLENLDIDLVKEGIGGDPRIGMHYLEPGLGFGGACLPKDCRFINAPMIKKQFTFQTAKTALEINTRISELLVKKIQKELISIKNRKIAILGVAFKPETDDTRESRALELVLKLSRKGAHVNVYDPFLEKPKTNKVKYHTDINNAIKGASILIVGCAHKQFQYIKPEVARRHVKKPLVTDYFRILNRSRWEKAGFRFI